MKAVIYRGMNETEYNIRKNGDTKDLYNMSWWSGDLLTAQLFATYAVLKCTINLNPTQQVDFKSGARGNLDTYEGFGVNELNVYSISKKCLEENVIDFEFLLGEKLIPKPIEVNNGLESLEESINVFEHYFDKSKNIKLSIKSKIMVIEQLKFALKESVLVKSKDNHVQIYKFV